MTASQNVHVSHFRQILLWPFRLEPKEGETVGVKALRSKARTKAIKRLCKPPLKWEEEPNLLDHLPPPPDANSPNLLAYQEYTYFHSFVREFLFGKTGSPSKENLADRPIRLLRLDKYSGVEVGFDNDVTGPFRVSFAVERINLYLFDTGIAILAVEIATDGEAAVTGGSDPQPRPLTLAHALTIEETFRRVYPPYWSGAALETAGLFPREVRWLPRSGSAGAPHRPLPCADTVAQVLGQRQPPVAGHWRELLEPLLVAPDAGDPKAPRLHQVIDERIPLMLYLTVEAPSAIDEADWVRLANADAPSEHAWPYGPAFLREVQKHHYYDRHWFTDPGTGAVDDKRSSRYLFSGYGFVAVGGRENGFFDTILRDHFRRHYFQMGLLAQFEVSTLLAVSDRLAGAEEAPEHRRPQRIRDELRQLLHFTQRYWFVDVSNQVQAREMFRLWRHHLNTKAHYRQVMEEARNATALLDAEDSRRGADETHRLTRVAGLALVPTLATGFLGMNVLVDGDNPALKAWGAGGWWTVLWALCLSALIMLVIYGGTLVKRPQPPWRWSGRVLAGVAVMLLLSFFGAWRLASHGTAASPSGAAVAVTGQ